jgi:hypothetical protein
MEIDANDVISEELRDRMCELLRLRFGSWWVAIPPILTHILSVVTRCMCRLAQSTQPVVDMRNTAIGFNLILPAAAR